MIAVVTSCSAMGWRDYGQNFVETFYRHWPVSLVDLHVVSEDDLSADIPVLDLWVESPAAMAFEERHRNNPAAHGKAPEQQTKSNKAKNYNFRFDAYRFAKKVFAVQAVAKRLHSGRLFWVDADVTTFASVEVSMLERLLPDDFALSCLDRGTSYHSECGFVGYNLSHPITRQFIDGFADLYASDAVFELGEWHDSWVFDWLRRKTHVPTFNIPHNSRHHPFCNSVLADVMDHKKGRRKQLGKTPSHEILSSKRRALSYWRE